MRCEWSGFFLAAVKLYNELFIDAGIDFIPVGETVDRRPKGILLKGKPTGNDAQAGLIQHPSGELPRRGASANLNLITRFNGKAGDVNFVAIDPDVTMINELASGLARLGEAEHVNNIVEARFEELQETVASDATFALRLRERATELLFGEAVAEAKLLLFVQSDRVVAQLAAEPRAMNPGRIWLLFERLVRPEDGLAEAPADACGRTCIT